MFLCSCVPVFGGGRSGSGAALVVVACVPVFAGAPALVVVAPDPVAPDPVAPALVLVFRPAPVASCTILLMLAR